MDEKELQALYNAMSAQFDVGDWETFKGKMQTPEQRKSFYGVVGENGFDLGEYSQYEQRLSGVKKKGSGASQALGGVAKIGLNVGSGLSNGVDLEDPPIYSVKGFGSGSKKVGSALSALTEPKFDLQGTPATPQYQDIQRRYKQATEVPFDENDPVKSMLTPIQNKLAEKRKENVSESTSSPIVKESKSAQMSNLIADKKAVEDLRFDNAKQAEEYILPKLDGSKLVRRGNVDLTKEPSLDDFTEESIIAATPKNNLTDQKGLQQYLDNRKMREILEGSASLEEAALKFTQSKGDVTGKQITALSGDIPNAMKGNMMMAFLQNPDLQEAANDNPELAQQIKNETFAFPQRYPQAAVRMLQQIISDVREQRGENNAILNITSAKTSDEIIKELAESGAIPANYALFYSRPEVRLAVNMGLKTPGILENFAGGLEQGVLGIGKSAADITGVRDLYSTEQDRLYNALDKQYRDFTFKPKGLTHQISTHGGIVTGQVLPMALGGTAIRAANLVKGAGTANAIMAGLQTWGENRDRALVDLPGESEGVQLGYATINTGIEVALANVLNDTKLASNLIRKASPEIKSVLKRFTNKEIGEAAAKEATYNIYDRLLQFGKGTVKTAGKEANEEAATQILQTANNQVFGGEPISMQQAAEDAFNVWTTTFLGSLPLGGAGGVVEINKNPEMPKLMYEVAANPDKYIEVIKGEEAIGNEKEAEQKIDNINHLVAVKQELDARGVDENSQGKFLLKSLSEKIITDKNEGIPDKALKKDGEKKLKEIEIEKDLILNPDTNNSTIVEEFYDNDLLGKGSQMILEDEKGKFSPNKVGDYLKFVAQQANNLDENWQPHEGKAPSTSEIPDAIIEIANERWKDEIGKAQIDPVRDLDMGTEPLVDEKPLVSVVMPEQNKKPNVVETVKEVVNENENTIEDNVTTEQVSPEESIRVDEEVKGDSGAAIPPTEPPKASIYVQRPKTELSFSGLQDVANEFGLEDVESRERKSDIQLYADARNKINEWVEKGTYEKNIEKLLQGVENRQLNLLDEQRVILQQHLANEVQRLRDIADKNSLEWQEQFNVVKRLKDVGQIARQESGAALRIPIGGGVHPVKDYGDAMVAMAEASGVEELSPEQKAEVEKYVANYEQKLKEADEKVLAAETKYMELQAQKEVGEAKKKYRKTNKDFSAERKQIVDDIRDKLKKARSSQNVTIIPYANELIAIAPDVVKLVKNLVEQGVSKLEDLVTEIHGIIKSEIPQVEEKDVVDLIAGKYNEPKQTKADLQRRLKDIANKKSVEAVQIRAKIEAGDFEKADKPVSWIDDVELKKKYPKEYNEALDALDAKEQAQLDFDIAVMKAEKSRQGGFKKTVEGGRAAISTLKAIKAGFDLSGLLIQNIVAMTAHPRSAGKSIVQSMKDLVSEKSFRRYLTQIHNGPMWDLMKQSGLDITDPKALQETNREEIFDNNLLNKDIKIGGKKYNIGKYSTRPFERAFTSIGNAMRVNMFSNIASKWMDEGKTFETHPEDYKSLATLLNTETGRGNLNEQIKKANKLVTSVIWSPRLMASRINMLGLSELQPLAGGKKGYYAGLSPQIRKMAIADMVKFIGTGAALMIFAASRGAQVDDDPESPTFGTIQVGKKRYNTWGGFTPYVKTVTQVATSRRRIEGAAKPVVGSGILGNFLRSRLTPFAGTVWNLIDRKDFAGKPITAEGQLSNLIIPLSIEAIWDGVKKDGAIGILSQGIPSIIGIGVADERDYEKKGETFDIKNPETATKRQATKEEYKQYEDRKEEMFEKDMRWIRKDRIPVDMYGDVVVDRKTRQNDEGRVIETLDEFAEEPKGGKTVKYSELSDKQKKQLEQKIRNQAGRRAKKELFGEGQDD